MYPAPQSVITCSWIKPPLHDICAAKQHAMGMIVPVTSTPPPLICTPALIFSGVNSALAALGNPPAGNLYPTGKGATPFRHCALCYLGGGMPPPPFPFIAMYILPNPPIRPCISLPLAFHQIVLFCRCMFHGWFRQLPPLRYIAHNPHWNPQSCGFQMHSRCSIRDILGDSYWIQRSYSGRPLLPYELQWRYSTGCYSMLYFLPPELLKPLCLCLSHQRHRP